ncbi:MAG: Uma2 family endonuclease [Oscillatoriales cyanobacterium C42_A2020_001]|nr:Uma2 family endonuclease [Leptolyngbyaceae cyanobacterium C42_A2020_001]
MLQYNRYDCLPSAEELPDSDDTPVDNELQNLVPNLLAAILAMAWSDRLDWFFGVDMGIYFAPDQPALVPDGFLSLGVERFVGNNGRLSYVLWEEEDTIPIFALEVVSKTYGGEYERKKTDYAELGILYYVIYAPTRQRHRRRPLEIYRLVDGKYELLPEERAWLPEIGLGIGREVGTYQGWQREWLYWYDEAGNRMLAPDERAEQERQRAEKLAAKLRELGVDPTDF